MTTKIAILLFIWLCFDAGLSGTSTEKSGTSTENNNHTFAKPIADRIKSYAWQWAWFAQNSYDRYPHKQCENKQKCSEYQRELQDLVVPIDMNEHDLDALLRFIHNIVFRTGLSRGKKFNPHLDTEARDAFKHSTFCPSEDMIENIEKLAEHSAWRVLNERARYPFRRDDNAIEYYYQGLLSKFRDIERITNAPLYAAERLQTSDARLNGVKFFYYKPATPSPEDDTTVLLLLEAKYEGEKIQVANAMKKGEIPDMHVFWTSDWLPGNIRIQRLMPPGIWGGEGHNFLEGMKNLIYSKLNHIPRDQIKICISGYSNGGHLAFFAAMSQPDIFTRAIALSPSLWAPSGNPKTINSLRNGVYTNNTTSIPFKRSSQKIYMSYGDKEVEYYDSGIGPNVEKAKEILKSKYGFRENIDLRVSMKKGGHKEANNKTNRFPGFSDGLQWAFQNTQEYYHHHHGH